MELHPDSSLVHRPGPNVRFTEEEKHLYHHVRIDETFADYEGASKGRRGDLVVRRRELGKKAWWTLTSHLRWPHQFKGTFLNQRYVQVEELHEKLHESEEQ